MNEVGKLDGILDEENRDVVSHQIEIAFVGVEPNGKAAHVARRIRRAAKPSDGRKAYEHRRFYLGVLKKARLRVLVHRLVHLKSAVRRGAPCMHDALGYALVVEVHNFFAQDMVFEQRRTTGASA